jgi:hypothetical protein
MPVISTAQVTTLQGVVGDMADGIIALFISAAPILGVLVVVGVAWYLLKGLFRRKSI